jgi:diaminohydroxyphosphoribosylaminopyrimidine deaminase/5-amino-6-(5-phosphoribosylamino)uracil reductase
MLDLAARAAFRGTGHVEPNPLVGCVIVRPGPGPAIERVIGIGHHRKFGDVHAEVDALRRCRELGHDPAGATAYVTLEPCNGHGRNPPCTKALVEARIGRVVCAAQDGTDGKGGGSAALRAVGIPCEFTGVSQRAIDLSAPWRHRTKTALPWVIAKWAQTIDGKLALGAGGRWISNERSRLRVHRLRSVCDAVMVGSGTVEADDPMLTVRGVPVRRSPLRVVLSQDGSLVPDRALVTTAREHPTLLLCEGINSHGVEKEGVRQLRVKGVDDQDWRRQSLMALRREAGVQTLMVEGGARLLGSLIEHELVNEAHVHVGPLVSADGGGGITISGQDTVSGLMGRPRRWRLVDVRRAGDDVQSVYRLT